MVSPKNRDYSAQELLNMVLVEDGGQMKLRVDTEISLAGDVTINNIRVGSTDGSSFREFEPIGAGVDCLRAPELEDSWWIVEARILPEVSGCAGSPRRDHTSLGEDQ